MHMRIYHNLQRFDKLKKNALTFCTPWAIQALWVFLIDLPILILNTTTTTTKEDSNSISIIDCVAWLLWIFGFVFEVTADAQKFAFRNNAKNHDKFITTGLWAFSQHPNYFGEILMWFAVALSATCAYTKPVHWLGWISPAFTYFLLLKVSGVPMLKKKADAKWKGQKDYDYYTQNTNEIIPSFSPTRILT
mmetsp:Transcript_13758/g.21974  ORF Transcript_13758/g.21974 Transcript_13758/m.21974 type:complete len:191 (-) Transcript_13758:91-663(-)